MKFSTGAVPLLEAVAVDKEAARGTTDTAPSATATGGIKMADKSVTVTKEVGPETADTALSTVVAGGVETANKSASNKYKNMHLLAVNKDLIVCTIIAAYSIFIDIFNILKIYF